MEPGVRPAWAAMRGMVVPCDAVLAEDFGGGLEEFALRFAAAGLLGLEGEGFGFCGGFGDRFSRARGGIFHRSLFIRGSGALGSGEMRRGDGREGRAGGATHLGNLCWSLCRGGIVVFQNGTGQYVRHERGAELHGRLGGGKSRFLLWGEPGLRRAFGFEVGGWGFWVGG